MDLQGSRTLYLYDVQKFNEILCLFLFYYNWAFILYLLVVVWKIYLDNIFYGSDFVLNSFMVLDTVNASIKDDASIYVVQSSNTTNNNDIMLFIICFMEYIVIIV